MLAFLAEMVVDVPWVVIGILLLVGLSVAVVAVVMILLRSREPVVRFIGWAIVVCGGIIISLFGMLWTFRAEVNDRLVLEEEARRAAEIVEVRRIEAKALAKQNGGMVPAWDTNFDARYEADRYSSPELAARALAMRTKPDLQAELDKLQTERDKHPGVPLNIQVNTASSVRGLDIRRIVTEFTNVLRREFPDTRVSLDQIEPDDDRPRSTASPITIDVGVGAAGASSSTNMLDEQYGSLYANILGIEPTKTIRCQFEVKPWLDSLQEFSKQHPERVLVVGSSRDFATSPADARMMAIADARKQLGIQERSTDSTLARLLDEGRLQIDSFVQRQSRPQGEVWREAILLDVSPAQIGLTYGQGGSVMDGSFIQRLLGFIGLLLVAMVLYLFLAGLTRGGSNVPAAVVIAGVILLVVAGFMLLYQFRQASSAPRVGIQGSIPVPLSRSFAVHASDGFVN